MQGYDAVAMKTDVQVGGTDQLFNIIVAGRKLQEALGQKPLVGIICGILPGTDGVQRMSKSTGNVIPINTSADDMYGKIMSIPDTAMIKYYRLATRLIPTEIDSIEKDLASGKLHPRDAKMKLAFEIVSIFYNEKDALDAQSGFVRLFQKGGIPEEMAEYILKEDDTVLGVMIKANLVSSNNEGRRLLEQNGVRLDGKLLTDGQSHLSHPGILQVGKRKFLRLR